MTSLRAGHFLAHFPEPGGTATAVAGLSRALVRLGHSVTIYGCGRAGSGSEESASGVEVQRFQAESSNPWALPPPLCARLSGNRDRLDLLVIHGMFSPANITVARLASEGRIPYVVCPHDPYHPVLLARRRLRKVLFGWLWERRVLNGAKAVQVLAPDHAAYLRRYGVRVPILVAPNGFDPAEAPPGEAAVGDGPDFLYLGRIDLYRKGLDLLLEALARGLQENHLPPQVRLHIAGRDWGDQPRVERLVRQLGLAGQVQFRGTVPDRWAAIAGCGMLVLPSRYEGFGLTVLEAMAVARPVLVSEPTGVATWVRQAACGFVVKPDPESICDGLERAVAARSLWSAMGARGQTFARRHLTWEQAAKQVSDHYQELCRAA